MGGLLGAWASGVWTHQSSGTTAFLEAVSFADASHGWAVGATGIIVATTNGGTAWTAQASGTTSDLFGVSFADAGHGWAVGALGTIVATANGGATWAAKSSGTTAFMFGVSIGTVDVRVTTPGGASAVATADHYTFT